MTSFIFRETLMTHLLLWGNAYSQIIRNGKGEVVALYPLMPDRMKVDRDEHGKLYYEYTVYDADDVDGRRGTDRVGRTVKLQPYDVLHIPGLGFDGLVGYSPIAMAKNAIGLTIATEEYGSKFFANGAAPSGVWSIRARSRILPGFVRAGRRPSAVLVMQTRLLFWKRG